MIPLTEDVLKLILSPWKAKEKWFCRAGKNRQFGNCITLMKVPCKDKCINAEPALQSRHWRDIKYNMHNAIESYMFVLEASASSVLLLVHCFMFRLSESAVYRRCEQFIVLCVQLLGVGLISQSNMFITHNSFQK